MRSTRTAAASQAAEGSARSSVFTLTAWLLGLLAILLLCRLHRVESAPRVARLRQYRVRPSTDRLLVLKLAAVCAGMFAFGFAMVPLYDAFCALTGFGGKTAKRRRLHPLRSGRPESRRARRIARVRCARRTVRVRPGGEPHRRAPGRSLRSPLLRAQLDGPADRCAGDAERCTGRGCGGVPEDGVLLLHASGVRAEREARPEGRVHDCAGAARAPRHSCRLRIRSSRCRTRTIRKLVMEQR